MSLRRGAGVASKANCVAAHCIALASTSPVDTLSAGRQPGELKMKRAMTGSIFLVLFAMTGVATAAEWATKDEAVAMVQKAVVFIKEQGPDKAYPEISNKGGRFIDRDLYVVVYGLDGKVLAHGANAALVGKDTIDSKDADGKAFVKERVELASKQPSFWQDYKFMNPVTKQIEPKQTYCERLDQTAVCAGIYKF
jgi:cytochrome c